VKGADSKDFSAIAQAALRAGPGLVMAWLPGGRLHGAEYDVLNPTRADQTTGNFRINVHTGKWADFATGDAGGDLISLWAYLQGLSQSDAASDLERQLGLNGYAGLGVDPAIAPFLVKARTRIHVEPEDVCCVPVPEEAPPAPLPTGQLVWSYLDGQGRLLGYVLRVDKGAGKKDFFPLTYWQTAGWKNKAWPRPRPLYNQAELAARRDAPVLVVEGEKTAEAARSLFSDFVAVTWPGGSSSASHANWMPLAGRRVWLLPDADAPGRKAMAEVAKALQARAEELTQFVLPANTPAGWDVADWTGSSAEAEAWLSGLTCETLKAPAATEDRLAEELRRANGQGPRYQVTEADEGPLPSLPAPLLAQLEQAILARVPMRCALAAQVATKAVMAHLVGRQAVSQSGDPTHLYLALAASSTGEIRPYLTAVRELMEQLGLEKTVRQQRLSSPQQVYKMLWRQPASLYLCSEWGVILQFAKRQPAGSIEQTLTVLSEVWDGTPITMDVDDIKLTDPGVDGQYIIRAPRLTMLAALSHDQLATALKLSEMGRGALEQIQYWIVQDDEFTEAPAEEIVTGPYPAALISGLQALATAVVGTGNLAGVTLPTQLPPQIKVPFAQPIEPFYAPLEALPIQRSARAMRSAARLLARREATSYAFSRKSQTPIESVITPELIQAGVASEVRRLNRLIARFAALSSEDGKLSAYEKVLDFITAEKGKGVRGSDLVSGCRPYRNLPDDKREALIKQLLADGAVVEIQPPSKPGARRKALIYVAQPFVREVA